MTSNNAKIREGYVKVTGGKVWYKIVGSGDNIPLITLHGGPGSTHNGLTSLEALADSRAVIFYDQLGCGNSDRPNDISLWTTERFVEELAQLRAALTLERVHILGHSWGTMLATDYLLTQPQGVASVVMSSPCISIPMWLEDCDRYIKQLPHAVQSIIMKHQKEGTTNSSEYHRAAAEFDKKHVNRLNPAPPAIDKGKEGRSKTIYETMWGPTEFFMTGNLKGYDRSQRLKEIKTPILFSCGRFDEATPKTTYYYHSLVSDSEIAIYENSAHMPQWEETDLYINTIRNFLDKTEAERV